MPNQLPGGVVSDPASDQNFRALSGRISDLLSRFLKLAVTGDVKVAFGTTEVTLAKEATKSAVQTVAHGLDAAPTVVHVQVQTGEGGATWGSRITERGTANIKFQINVSDPLAEETTVTALWTATG